MLFTAALALALGGPVYVASGSRCNNIVSTKLEDRARGFDRRPPNATDRNDRYVALQGISSEADQEADILHAVCPEADFPPLEAQLLAVKAWTLLLEADLNQANYAARCPAAATPVASALVGNAWLLIVRADPESTGRSGTVNAVKPKVLSRAAALSLTLPTVDDASAYWVTQLQQKADEAAAGCPK